MYTLGTSCADWVRPNSSRARRCSGVDQVVDGSVVSCDMDLDPDNCAPPEPNTHYIPPPNVVSAEKSADCIRIRNRDGGSKSLLFLRYICHYTSLC